MSVLLLTKDDLIEAIEEANNRSAKNIRIEAARIMLPKWIKTSAAARLIDVTPDTLIKRIKSGIYIEGADFKKDGVKLYLWDRDRLILELKETP